jgi:CheY-like chemotaxis protein
MGRIPERGGEPRRNDRIVIVDDEEQNLLLFEHAGRDPSVTIFCLLGPSAALRRLYKMGYDVDAIVADLKMAEMTGIQMTRTVRESEMLFRRETPIKVYWFTGWPVEQTNALDPVVAAAKELNVERIIQKPYDPTALVREVLADIRAGREAREGDVA